MVQLFISLHHEIMRKFKFFFIFLYVLLLQVYKHLIIAKNYYILICLKITIYFIIGIFFMTKVR